MLSAVVSKATAADHEIIAAVAGKQIKVHGYMLVAAGAVNVTWKNGTTALTGAMTMAAGTPIDADQGSDYAWWFLLDTNTALNLTLSGAVQVSGHVSYSLL